MELVGKGLTHHALHALTLNQEQLSGKQTPVSICPDDCTKMVKQILGLIGSMKVVDIVLSPSGYKSR